MFDPKENLIDLKGKKYLQVMWRLVWFREEHKDWAIFTNIIEHDAEHAIFKAVICDENGVQKSVGHGSESKRDFGDFLEKAETKAVGRALAMLGYGTQFTALELDEGERIVDSPVKQKEEKPAEEQPEGITCERCGKPITDAEGFKGPLTAEQVIRLAQKFFGANYCAGCQRELNAKRKKEKADDGKAS